MELQRGRAGPGRVSGLGVGQPERGDNPATGYQMHSGMVRIVRALPDRQLFDAPVLTPNQHHRGYPAEDPVPQNAWDL